MPAYRPLADRFWDKVDRNGQVSSRELGQCWEWTACLMNGYGAIVVGRIPMRAHRVSYLLNVGLIPDGLCVCHKCDNPKCVRPDHLFLGTKRDNSLDMVRKVRRTWATGEGSVSSKLTAVQVTDVKLALSHGLPGTRIAAWLGIKKSAAYDIKRGRTWGSHC